MLSIISLVFPLPDLPTKNSTPKLEDPLFLSFYILSKVDENDQSHLLVKRMTVLKHIVFDQIKEKRIKYDDRISRSDCANDSVVQHFVYRRPDTRKTNHFTDDAFDFIAAISSAPSQPICRLIQNCRFILLSVLTRFSWSLFISSHIFL